MRLKSRASAAAARLSEFVASVRGRPQASAPPRASTGGPLDAVNDDFHASYDHARQAAKYDGPVLVVLADELVLFQRGSRRASRFAPRTFHLIKSVAHAPVALYAAFEQSEPPRGAELSRMRARVTSSVDALRLEAAELSSDAYQDLEEVLRASRQLLDQTLETGVDRARLDAFARRMGPALLRLAREATRLQLRALHEHTERALARLSDEECQALHVIVAGDHQARARSLAMQYFKRRLNEPASEERRVSYAEGAADERAALELVGTQRLDRALALSFFGEETRLQRDILGDAAEQELQSMELHPLRAR